MILNSELNQKSNTEHVFIIALTTHFFTKTLTKHVSTVQLGFLYMGGLPGGLGPTASVQACMVSPM